MTSELRKPPTEGVTRLRYSPVAGDSHLVVSSWDAKLRVYDTATNELRGIHEFKQPLLDCTFLRNSKTCGCAGLGREVVFFDLEKESAQTMGHHDAAIRCLNFHAGNNLLFSGSWDSTVKAWDSRSKCEAGRSKANGKVYAMALNQTRLVVCDSSKQVSIFDLRNLNEPEEIRNQLLKYQYRTAEAFPDQNGFAVSSVEGRVAWEYLPTEQTGKKPYAFKCHREKDEDNVEKVYPVNALAFHPVYGTFATGGGDGVLSVWDGYKMKRLWRLPRYPTSITSIAFTASGNQMAISVSYDFSQGMKSPLPATQIVLRQVQDEDCQPKNT